MNELARSVGFNPVPYIMCVIMWSPIENALELFHLVHAETHIADFVFILIITRHQAWMNSAPILQLFMLQTGFGCRPGWLHLSPKLNLTAVAWRDW